jgi:hypothetical protein
MRGVALLALMFVLLTGRPGYAYYNSGSYCDYRHQVATAILSLCPDPREVCVKDPKPYPGESDAIGLCVFPCETDADCPDPNQPGCLEGARGAYYEPFKCIAGACLETSQ